MESCYHRENEFNRVANRPEQCYNEARKANQLMHRTLFQSLFEHSFYQISDLAFLFLNAYAASIVSKGRWRLHLNWLVPFVFQGVLTLVYRGIISLHYFFGIHISVGGYTFGENCLYTANVLGIAGNVILCRTLKQIVNAADGKGQRGNTPQSPADESVWPPPPKRELL